MEEKNWLEVMQEQRWLKEVEDMNPYTKQYGLELSKEDALVLVAQKKEVLKAQKRVEFGASILPELIYAFCDSSYLRQDEYLDVLIRLQEIFFLYKNEMRDEITDHELISFMREQFEGVCCGDMDYLETTCLEVFAQAIGAGYQGYRITEGKGVYSEMDLVPRWDRELYEDALRKLLS